MATPARSSVRTLADRWTLEETKPVEEVALERGLLTGIAAFRWVTWVWMAVVLLFDARSSSLERPWAAVVAIGVTLVWTLVASVLVRLDPARLLTKTALGIELAIAAALVFADWWVYGRVGGVWSSHAQSLGVAWPAASVLSVGVAFGTAAGFLAGTGLGIARLIGQLAFWVDADSPLGHGDNQLAAAGTIVMYALVGGLAGLITTKLREAEREVAVARARDEVARTLHDGVLQTLAVVQRRSNDPELAALAREQEVELRQYLFGTRVAPATGSSLRRGAGTTDLAAILRDAAAEAERRQSIRADIVLTDELPPISVEVADAVRGAVAESLVNASKHGGATHAIVFLEHDPTDGLFCSVKDDGTGFDAADHAEGIGITRSMRGRLDEVGGTVEVDGRPGRGTEVRIRVPA